MRATKWFSSKLTTDLQCSVSRNSDMSDIDQSESALRENISKKGKNAYYYAHGNTANGPAWDGKEEPRLLAVGVERTISKPLASQFDSFSWLDETKNVKVYVDFENANDIDDENISLVSYVFLL